MAYFFALSRARFLTEIKPNSAYIFPCYCLKQLDSMLPCVCSVTSQKTSKCGKNISDTLGYASCATFLFLPHFDVIWDLLLNRHTTTWNLVVNYTSEKTP